jgi:surface antigen
MHGPTSLLPPSLNAPASAQQAGSSEVCRSYTSMKTLLGQQRQVSGLACRDTNGQWQIITELPD